MSTIAHLNITTWLEHDANAEHYYGKLTWPESDFNGHQLQHILTAREAAYLNKKIGRLGLNAEYGAGGEHSGFNSEAAVRKAALEKYKELCPDADFLIEGDPVYAEPQQILAGDETIMAAANELYEEFEALNGYADPKNYAKASDLSKKWKECFEAATP